MKKTMLLYFILTASILLGKSQTGIDKDLKQLENKLNVERYSSLFLSSGTDKVDKLWKTHKKESFVRLLNDSSVDDNVRFLAAEILFHKSEGFPSKNSYEVLASIYAHALIMTGVSNEKFMLAANGWGYLYEMDSVGFIGERLILIGEPAVKYLKGLLENNDNVLYEGSEEATLGNSYRYRIKDIAAFYISKIKKIPVKFHKNIEERDREIARLKELLKEN